MSEQYLEEENEGKVIRRHHPGVTFIAIFCFLMAILPLGLLLYPWNQIILPQCDLYPSLQSGAVLSTIDGLSLGKYMIMFSKANPGFVTLTQLSAEIGAYRGNTITMTILRMILIGGNIFLYAVVLFSVLLLIASLVMLFRGRTGNKKTPLIFMIVDFIFFALLMGCSALLNLYVQYALDRASVALNVGRVGITMNWLNIIVFGGAALLLLILVIIFYASCLAGGHYASKEEEKREIAVQMIKEEEVAERENTNYVPRGLPDDLQIIGGHAFNKNLDLEEADIPANITELGAGSFSNCLNLKIVYIPNTVKVIGYNCFYNCQKLQRINYGGTKSEWRHIRRGSNWLAKAGTKVVVCRDGPVSVNPYN